MSKLLLASSNAGKLAELQSLLADLHLQLVLPDDISITMEVPENADSYAGNAELKANAFCKASGLPTIADDTGLEVDALGGMPGLHSARFTGSHRASDAERRSLLLNRLEKHPHPWKARFVCAISVAFPTGETLSGHGECLGEIIPGERGKNGFGYDPIFLIQRTGKTMAELTLEEKNRLSHRALAINSILPELKKHFAVFSR
jgi:XTP/dITP diphosphohydrolase